MTSKAIEVVSTNISNEKGTIKKPVAEIRIDANGVVQDAHAQAGNRQVSILAMESIERFSLQCGREFKVGEFAENLTIKGLDLREVDILDRFRINKVELEISQKGKQCHGDGCAIYREIGKCIMPREGIFCRVIRSGVVKAGDRVEYTVKKLKFRVITVSDRASRGEYEDKSGPAIKSELKNYFADKHRQIEIETTVIPDETQQLKDRLNEAIKANIDVIFTTGGTGVGPRDITVDTVSSVADKTIPGIMESIRVKYGTDNPNALLSRSIAACVNKTLIYTLPGSVKAVKEYTQEISKTLEHLIYMLHGLDVH